MRLQLSPRITWALRNKRGSVQRLRRQLTELATAAGQFVPDVGLPLVAQPKQSMQLRRAETWSWDIIRACSGEGHGGLVTVLRTAVVLHQVRQMHCTVYSCTTLWRAS